MTFVLVVYCNKTLLANLELVNVTDVNEQSIHVQYDLSNNHAFYF